MENTYEVYAITDSRGLILALNSSGFVDKFWGTKIDQGDGDKYKHAQNNYFPEGLYTPDGIPLYKLANGQAAARTEEEIQADRPDPLPAARAARQEENKAALAAWLCAHPLTWTDGKQYGVEEQDQNEMALNLMQYQAAQQAGRTAPLEWHAQKEACRAFSQEEYLGLSMAISAYVYPYRRYQEAVKEAVYAARTVEELSAVVIDYSGVEAAP